MMKRISDFRQTRQNSGHQLGWFYEFIDIDLIIIACYLLYL